MEGIPKNIRQVGGREERLKVYMEDYVNTYLRKLQEDRGEAGAAGMLIGGAQEEAGKSCVFVDGAVEMSGADTGGGRLTVTDDAWNSLYEDLNNYFPGRELCGIFVCEGACRRFRRQALFRAVRECFPEEGEALLFVLSEEGEEIVYRIGKKNEERLQGYFCYFERNEEMQEYMMEHLRERQVEKEPLPVRRRRTGGAENGEMSYGSESAGSESARNVLRDRASGDESAWSIRYGKVSGSEGSLGMPQGNTRMENTQGEASPGDGAAQSARERMNKEGQDEEARRAGRGVFRLCAMMAAVVFICGLFLMRRENSGVQVRDILDELRSGAERLLAVSGEPEESSTETVLRQDRPVVVEEIPGNVFPTGSTESGAAGGASESSSDTSTGAPAEAVTEAPTGVPAEAVTDAPADTPSDAPTEAMTGAATEAPTDTSTEAPTEALTEAPTEAPTEPLTEASTEAPPQSELPASTGVTYEVQAGDSLYSISRRFYGTEAMVSTIQELNNLSDADLIKEGQKLLLP